MTSSLLTSAVSNEETIDSLVAETRELWRAFGEELLAMKKPFGKNDKGFGQWLKQEAPELAEVDSRVRSESMWLAANWEDVSSSFHSLESRISFPTNIHAAFRKLNKPAETQDSTEVETFKIVEEKVAERVVKAQRLSENDGATDGERAAARNAVEKLAKRENMEVEKFLARCHRSAPMLGFDNAEKGVDWAAGTP